MPQWTAHSVIHGEGNANSNGDDNKQVGGKDRGRPVRLAILSRITKSVRLGPFGKTRGALRSRGRGCTDVVAVGQGGLYIADTIHGSQFAADETAAIKFSRNLQNWPPAARNLKGSAGCTREPRMNVSGFFLPVSSVGSGRGRVPHNG